MHKSLQCSTGANVHYLEARVLAIGQDLHGIGWMELNRSDSTLVQSRNVSGPITSSHIPKTKAAVHVTRNGSEGIGTNI
jgi:hypothetical protein